MSAALVQNASDISGPSLAPQLCSEALTGPGVNKLALSHRGVAPEREQPWPDALSLSEDTLR